VLLAKPRSDSKFVQGHEFTHGFDDTGRRFDAKSRLREWWDKPAVQKFQKHSKCISNLYEGFTIADVGVDGNNTLGECTVSVTIGECTVSVTISLVCVQYL
jgi:predicted metalloendopeptidase